MLTAVRNVRLRHRHPVGLINLVWTHISDDFLTGPLPNANNFLIVADQYLRNIYQVDPTSGTTAQLLSFGTATNPLALAYDSTRKLIYWTDVNAKTINRYSLLTNTSTVIYRDPLNVGKDIHFCLNWYKQV